MIDFSNRIQLSLVATTASVILALPMMYLLNVFEARDISHPPFNSDYILYLNVFFILLLFIFEIKTMSTNLSEAKSFDKGYISAITTIAAVLYMPVLDRYSWHFFLISDKDSLYSYIGGLVIFVMGMAIRIISSNQLGKFFTHELHVSPDQIVIKKGLYRYIRHPAYLGTLMLVLGLSWMFSSNIGLLLIFPMLILALNRIKNEENMLKRSFGLEYEDYMTKTKKIIPFIL